MINDLGVIFKVYLISLGLQFLVWPWVSKWFGDLKDRGWALGRVLGLLAISLPIWFVGHALPVNTEIGIAITLLLLVLIGLRSVQHREKLNKIILIEEGLFFFGLLTLSLVRAFQPDILGLEKFMDFGFIKQYLISSSLPINDMWLAGESINYYSFGHFLASILVRVWGVGLGLGYNLILGWILGTSLALSFSVIVTLGGGVIGGLMGAFLTSLGGNSHALWYLLKNRGLTGYWYADATRFIENTIHEFPGYSFVVSDLHGHVLGFPIVLAFILVLIGVRSRLRGVILGIFIGVMMMTNTWDVAIYGLLLIVFGLLLLIYRKIKVRELFILILIIGGTAGATALPWLLTFRSFSDGVSLVSTRSPVWQMGVLWFGHVTITLLAFWLVWGKKIKKQYLAVVAIGLTSILLLLIPEMLYVRDIYSSHQRANTMFKLTYQAFIMMSLLFGWVVGNQKTKYFTRVVMVFLWGGLMIFPVQAFSSYYGGFKKYQGLDGLVWLRKDKDRWGIIEYLEKNRDGKNLVEAVGDSYSKLNSVSAFSGTPTVVGWRVHEWLWRGGYDVVRKREGWVKDFYETENKNIIDDFNVGWVVVGPDEKKEYNVNENKIFSLGEVVWSGRESYLVKVTD